MTAFSIKAEHPKTVRRKLGFDYVWPGLIGQLVSAAVLSNADHSDVALWYGLITLILAMISIHVGSYKCATYKRYPSSVALLGLLSVPGLMILYALPRRSLLGKRGFEVVVPKKVSTLWVVDPETDGERGGYRPFIRLNLLQRSAAEVDDE